MKKEEVPNNGVSCIQCCKDDKAADCTGDLPCSGCKQQNVRCEVPRDSTSMKVWDPVSDQSVLDIDSQRLLLQAHMRCLQCIQSNHGNRSVRDDKGCDGGGPCFVCKKAWLKDEAHPGNCEYHLGNGAKLVFYIAKHMALLKDNNVVGQIETGSTTTQKLRRIQDLRSKAYEALLLGDLSSNDAERVWEEHNRKLQRMEQVQAQLMNPYNKPEFRIRTSLAQSDVELSILHENDDEEENNEWKASTWKKKHGKEEANIEELGDSGMLEKALLSTWMERKQR